MPSSSDSRLRRSEPEIGPPAVARTRRGWLWAALPVAAGLGVDRPALAAAPLADLVEPEELALIRLMATFPRTLEAAATHHEPHRIAFYLGDLAASFHALWNQGKERPELRFLRPDQPAVSQARLAMITAVQIVLASGLELIGVTPVEEMV